MLGLPTGGLIDRNASRSVQTLYHGVWFQDDWKLSNRLTLNLGLRYDYEGATAERYDRNTRDFETTAANPVEAAARAAYAAAYAANPNIAPVTPDNFRVRGGLLFADQNDRGFWEPDANNFQPRAGIAYQPNDKTVLRAGWGIYTNPFIFDYIQQAGFSQATNIVPSLNNGLTFVADLSNPFPNGVVNPPGTSLGLGTFVGREVNFQPLDHRNGQLQRWLAGVQREFPGRWLVEASYVGARGYDITTSENVDLNPVPRQYLSTSPVRDTTVINYLTALVANPFAGLAPGTNLNSATVQRQQLLRPFPQFTRVRTRLHDGETSFHSGQLRAERRFSEGYMLLFSYTWSKALEAVTRLNQTDTTYERRVADYDAPHRFVGSGILEIPFGRNRRWGNGLNPAIDAALGGWRLGVIYQAQSGRPLTLGNVAFFGDPGALSADVSSATVDGAFDTSGFFPPGGVGDIRLDSNIRTLPTRLPRFRGQGINNWDLSLTKKFFFTERVRGQIRGELINAFNTPIFDNPNLDPTSSNFSRVTSQNNLPRQVQVGLRLEF